MITAFFNEYMELLFVVMFFCVFTTLAICISLFHRVIIPSKLEEARFLKPNYCKALDQIEALQEENTKLKEELDKYKKVEE